MTQHLHSCRPGYPHLEPILKSNVIKFWSYLNILKVYESVFFQLHVLDSTSQSTVAILKMCSWSCFSLQTCWQDEAGPLKKGYLQSCTGWFSISDLGPRITFGPNMICWVGQIWGFQQSMHRVHACVLKTNQSWKFVWSCHDSLRWITIAELIWLINIWQSIMSKEWSIG